MSAQQEVRQEVQQPGRTAEARDAAGERARRLRTALGLLVALGSDALAVFFVLLPPMQIALDLLTGALLFALFGFRWPLLPALVLEAIPGLALFPSWTLAVGALFSLGRPAARAPQDES